MKRKKLNYKKQKKLFAKTAGVDQTRSINMKPAPMRGGYRL